MQNLEHLTCDVWLQICRLCNTFFHGGGAMNVAQFTFGDRGVSYWRPANWKSHAASWFSQTYNIMM